jgi:predicted transcriptional regulator
VELRRVKPKKLRNGSIVIVYVSSPQQTLSGAFKVAEVVQRPLQELWELVKDKAGISKEEYDEYFSGSHQGVAIFISEVLCLTNPIKLRDLRARILNFNPPQSFRYTNLEEINIPLLQNTIL